MSEAGLQGHYSNDSLEVSSATRLFAAEVDEQLIMSRIWHFSTDGVHAYKRASNKLKQITSNVLNCAGSSKEKCLQSNGSPKLNKLCAQDK